MDNRKHCESHPIFKIKDPLQPVIAKSPMNVSQIDLVIMEKHPLKEYNIFLYLKCNGCILSIYLFKATAVKRIIRSSKASRRNPLQCWNSKCNSM